MLAAVRALGNQLEAAKAVDADEAPRELGGPQPGLATSRAVRTSEGTLARILRLGRIAQAAFDSFGHLTRVASG
jgi:hypothetical protein